MNRRSRHREESMTECRTRWLHLLREINPTPRGIGCRLRRLAVLSSAATLGIAGCKLSPAAPTFPVTYATVAVSNGSLRVGDTTSAEGQAWSAQVLLRDPGSFIWSVGDSTIVHLEATASNKRVVVYGIKPGTTVIRATVSGVTGLGGISVVP